MIGHMKHRANGTPYRRGSSQLQSGATLVEFALVAPIVFGVLIGFFSVATYVFEVQVANQAAQAASRWAVARDNFAGTPATLQCPDSPPPPGMVKVAQAAAGFLAGSLSVVDKAASPGSSLQNGSYGCQIEVTVPYVSFGGYFGLGPPSITATAIDYVT